MALRLLLFCRYLVLRLFDVPYSCLDVIKISWSAADVGGKCEECAIILEVSESACVLHTNTALPAGAPITLKVEGNRLPAQVSSVEQDEFGSYLTITLTEPWFPALYEPAYLSNQLNQRTHH